MADAEVTPACSVVKKTVEKVCKMTDKERKRLKISGSEYVTQSKKIISKKKPPKNEVSCKCKKNCANISHQQKMDLFGDYYKLETNELQGTYLMGLINILPIKRRRHGKYSDASLSKRQCTVSYSLPNGEGNLLEVCRKTFAEVFDLKQKKIHVLINKVKSGELTYKENRGKSAEKLRKYTADDKNAVKAHVNSFPRQESHYGRARSNKEYLSPDLNINRMFKAFKIKNPHSHVTYKFYRSIFKNEFKNISFGRKKTDTCATCDILNAQIKADVPGKKQLELKRSLHQAKANKALSLMKMDFARSQMPTTNICSAAMDLQQVLSTPVLTHSQMYYSRQLSNFNLGIHIGGTNDGYMCLWHEGISGRGGNEIASCVHKVFTNPATTSKRHLIIWSDNCCGQNKNRMIILLWMYLIRIGIFDVIEHKFLISGHSFLSCDRDFALIERRKRVCSPMTPNDLIKIITEARDVPFKVEQMQEQDFYDFQKAADGIIDTKKLSISKAQWIKISKPNIHKIRVRTMINDMQPWRVVNVLKRNKTANDLDSINIPPLACQSKISEAKKTDLINMIQYMQKESDKSFYLNLLNN